MLNPLTRYGESHPYVQAPSLDDLRAGLQEAIKAEDYGTAARIRDRIAQVEQEDPVVTAERELEQAVAEERFEVGSQSAVRPLPAQPGTSVSSRLDLRVTTAHWPEVKWGKMVSLCSTLTLPPSPACSAPCAAGRRQAA